MDTHVLEVAAQSAGVLPSAVEDAVRRLAGHFATQADPTPELIEPAAHPPQSNRAPSLSPVPGRGRIWGAVRDAPRGLARAVPSRSWRGHRDHGYALPRSSAACPRSPSPLSRSRSWPRCHPQPG